MQLCLICFFLISSWQEAGVQEALGKLLTTEHMSSSMKLLTLQGWYLVKFGEHMYMYMYLSVFLMFLVYVTDSRFLVRLHNAKLN